jgi:NAD(P)-dependent dehydrogenase (short-subunit alcohol dehydrogenase family)
LPIDGGQLQWSTSSGFTRTNGVQERGDIDKAYLNNKVGLVTGGGTGIGRATALAMAGAGASLVIGNRNAKLGEEVVRTIEQAGGRAVVQVTDVSKPEDAKALLERTVS